jgi:hypothetical protein
MRLHVGLIKYAVTSFGYMNALLGCSMRRRTTTSRDYPRFAGRRSTALIHRWRPSVPRPHNIDPRSSAQSPTGGRSPLTSKTPHEGHRQCAAAGHGESGAMARTLQSPASSGGERSRLSASLACRRTCRRGRGGSNLSPRSSTKARTLAASPCWSDAGVNPQFGSRVRTWWRSGREREALRVVIERAEWSNFRHLALILEYE